MIKEITKEDLWKLLEEKSKELEDLRATNVRTIKSKCDWCREDRIDRGELFTISLHEGCYEAILNGEAVI